MAAKMYKIKNLNLNSIVYIQLCGYLNRFFCCEYYNSTSIKQKFLCMKEEIAYYFLDYTEKCGLLIYFLLKFDTLKKRTNHVLIARPFSEFKLLYFAWTARRLTNDCPRNGHVISINRHFLHFNAVHICGYANFLPVGAGLNLRNDM